MKPTIKIVNLADNSEIERQMNDEELAQYETDQQNFAKLQAEIQYRLSAKATLLDKLGITEEEARLLLG